MCGEMYSGWPRRRWSQVFTVRRSDVLRSQGRRGLDSLRRTRDFNWLQARCGTPLLYMAFSFRTMPTTCRFECSSFLASCKLRKWPGRIVTGAADLQNRAGHFGRTRARPRRASGAVDKSLFEFSALTWEVELWGFEPQTSCMPSAGRPSTGVHRRRSPSRAVHPSMLSSASVAVLPRCTSCKTSRLGRRCSRPLPVGSQGSAERTWTCREVDCDNAEPGARAPLPRPTCTPGRHQDRPGRERRP